MNLSPHLTVAEVTASVTAGKLGIENSPTAQHLDNLRALAGAIFEPLRVNFGVPIYVSSGYRSQALNDAVPGSSRKSQHMEGEALDLDQHGRGKLTNREVFLWIRDNLPFDQLIWEYGTETEPDWVHVSYTQHRKRRGEVLRGVRSASGAPVYPKWWGPKSSSGR